MNKFFKSRHWKVFLVTFAISAPIFALSLFGEVFFLLVMSLALTMVLKPIVDYLENKSVPRPAAILGIYVIIGGVTVFALMNIYPIIVHQVSNLSSSMDNEHLSAMLKQMASSISQQVPFIKADAISERLSTILPEIAKKAEESLTSMLSLVASLIIVPFITFFLLNDYYKMQKALIENLPNKYFEMSLNVVKKLEEQISKFIRGTCIESFFVAILYAVSYQIIGVNYAIVLGIIGGIMNIIPLAGPFIGALPVLGVSIAQYGNLSMLIPIAVSTIVVQQLDQVFVQPAVFSKIMNIHPLTMFLVILIGGNLLGVMGMVLSIPIYTIIVVTARETNWGLKSYRITE